MDVLFRWGNMAQKVSCLYFTEGKENGTNKTMQDTISHESAGETSLTGKV